jgi:hypothetical protein
VLLFIPLRRCPVGLLGLKFHNTTVVVLGGSGVGVVDNFLPPVYGLPTFPAFALKSGFYNSGVSVHCFKILHFFKTAFFFIKYSSIIAYKALDVSLDITFTMALRGQPSAFITSSMALSSLAQ